MTPLRGASILPLANVEGNPVNKLFRGLKSLRLAIVLIVYLAITGILSTLVPQGAGEEAYRALFPGIVAQAILATGFDHFFTSPVFILPAFLFFANLSTCAVDRFVREIKKKGRRRHGPDVLHLGLVLLVIGAILSFSGHQEGAVTLLPGEGVNLPDGSTLELLDFRFERYPDGRPKDWTSGVRLTDAKGKVLKDRYELKVNSPLRHGGLTLYQASYSYAYSLALRDASGREIVLAQGEERKIGDRAYFFMAPEDEKNPASGKAVLRLSDAREATVLRVASGDRAGNLEVIGMRESLAAGLSAVRDPGYPLALPAMLLVALGTAMTFWQKIKEGV